MKKLIGITCDDYKTKKYRARLIKEGFALEYDGDSGIKNVHLFRVETTEEKFNEMTEKVRKVLAQLEVEMKLSN